MVMTFFLINKKSIRMLAIAPLLAVSFAAGDLWAADEMCVQGFKGCVDGSVLMYSDCKDWGDCAVTLEEAKDQCMQKYPDCADRAYVEQRFKEGLAR